jgi:hypothetical protein
MTQLYSHNYEKKKKKPIIGFDFQPITATTSTSVGGVAVISTFLLFTVPF